MPITADELADSTPNLSTLARRRLSAMLGKADGRDFEHGEASLFWVADWLTGLKLLNAEQLQLFLDVNAERLLAFGGELQGRLDLRRPHKSTSAALPVCRVGFADRRYAVVDGADSFLDLENGDALGSLPTQPLETITYNLTTLFVRYASRLRPKKGGDDGH